MYLSELQSSLAQVERRGTNRLDLQCRARIRIGPRQYAGYLHNISRTGAKLRTITPIHKVGKVILRLPDLPPLHCRLCWTDAYNAGVSFELPLTRAELSDWARNRLAHELDDRAHCDIRDFADLASWEAEIQLAK